MEFNTNLHGIHDVNFIKVCEFLPTLVKQLKLSCSHSSFSSKGFFFHEIWVLFISSPCGKWSGLLGCVCHSRLTTLPIKGLKGTVPPSSGVLEIEWVIQHKNLLNFLNFLVICEIFHTFQKLCIPKRLLCYVEAVDILY